VIKSPRATVGTGRRGVARPAIGDIGKAAERCPMPSGVSSAETIPGGFSGVSARLAGGLPSDVSPEVERGGVGS